MKHFIPTWFYIAIGCLSLRAQTNVPSTLAQWSFDGPEPYAATQGAGSWQTLGGVHPSLASGTGSSDPVTTGNQALNLAGFPGATNLVALAGIEFATSTIGFRNLSFRFDLRATATASRHVQAWYSLDGGLNFQAGPKFTLTNAGTFQKGFLVDLHDVPAAGNRQDLRVRLISTTGPDGHWEGVATKYSPSGAWRLDQVEFTGKPINPTSIQPPVTAPTITFTNHISNRVHWGEPTNHSFREMALRPAESLQIEVTLQDTNRRPVTLQAIPGTWPNGARWELPNTAGSTARAVFRYTATDADAGHEFRIGLAAANGATWNHWWTLYIPTAEERALTVSEFLAKPAGGSSEFIELVSIDPGTLPLSGWSIGDATAVRHRMGKEDRLLNGHAWVIWTGAISNQVAPAGSTFVGASSGGLSLNNGGDQIVLRNAQSNLVERVVYRASEVVAGVSLVRDRLPDGPFRSHRTLGASDASPGLTTDGKLWGDSTATTTGDLKVRLSITATGELQLHWQAIPGQAARVLFAPELGDPFTEIARDLVNGEFSDTAAGDAGFYRVVWQ